MINLQCHGKSKDKFNIENVKVNYILENAIKVKNCTLKIDLQTLNSMSQSQKVAIFLEREAKLHITNFTLDDAQFRFNSLISANFYKQVRSLISL